MHLLAPAGDNNNSSSSAAGLSGPSPLDALRMNVNADQSTPSAVTSVAEKLQAAAAITANKQHSGTNSKPGTNSSTLASSALESSIWALPAIMPQLSATLDAQLDSTLDTPFLNPIGALALPASVFFNPAADATCNTPRPISNGDKGSRNGDLAHADSTAALEYDSLTSLLGASSFPNATSQRAAFRSTNRVSWLDSSLDGNGAPALGARGLQGCPSLEDLQQQLLASAHSAPAPGAGDLRDQGRLSSAGLAYTLGSGSISGLLGAAYGMMEDTGTPLKAGTISTDCINNLLGSLGTSLFDNGLPATPPSYTAAAPAAAPAGRKEAAGSASKADKPAPVLPDFVEAWEGCMGGSDVLAAAAAAAPDRAGAGMKGVQSSGGDRRRISSSSGGAFAGAAGSVSAAVAAAGCPSSSIHPGRPSSGASGAGGAGSRFMAPYPHPLAHAYSSPMPGFAAPAASNCSSAAGRSYNTAGLAYQHSFPQACSGMQQPASTAVGIPEGYSALGGLAYNSSAYVPNALSNGMQVPLHGHSSTALPLQGTLSVPLGHSYSNQAFAAVMQAYCQAGMLATGSAGMYEAWMLAYLSSVRTADSQGSPNTNSSSSDNGSSWNSQAGQHFPPVGRRLGTGYNSLDAGMAGFASRNCHPSNLKICRKYGSAANSKVDPKSLCGVDPRLCVGNPSDVEFEVCRRNAGLAELLRLPPRSVKLNNIPVRQDTSPADQLASKRADGPITPEELTIESGLLRHCFGLPSSIGPDLVRAARHAVTRGDKLGSGLEPFFWVLQAKLNWLLKRPVFFKGQLLRGEIHAITDQQRAQSFAQVTEQRSKLAELLLVLYRMLQQ